ncbi:HEAT repeat domain-containing protein [Mucisphaera sp.]|uniref:HEAT repeat domain-containing protein n=1 Tax=Mucisphaera sp. TaxID=2913024 RepID=UPI003D0A6B05
MRDTACPLLPKVLAAALCLALFGFNGCRSDREAIGPDADRLPERAPAAVYGLVSPFDADARRVAAGEVAKRGLVRKPGYAELLIELTTDEDPTVRAAAVRALMTEPAVSDAPAMIALLDNRVAYVRWEAAAALGRLHAPESTEALMQAARNDEVPIVRLAAAKALGQYREPMVFDVLVGVLDDRDAGVTAAAQRSLSLLTGQDLGPEPADWARWAADNRANLFAEARPYVYEPYPRSPYFYERLTPWDEDKSPPRAPAGL